MEEIFFVLSECYSNISDKWFWTEEKKLIEFYYLIFIQKMMRIGLFEGLEQYYSEISHINSYRGRLLYLAQEHGGG